MICMSIKNGKLNGQGTFTWNEYCGMGYPKEYKGQFKNGLPNGKGTEIKYYQGTGKIEYKFVGQFKNGKKHGYGRQVIGRGRLGEFKNDELLRSGKGVGFKDGDLI